MGVNLVLVDDNNNEYRFNLGITDSSTGSWFTPNNPSTDDWGAAVDLVADHFGNDFAFNAMVLSVGYNQPQSEIDVLKMALWHEHIRDILTYAKDVNKGYPNAQISALCDNPKAFPTDTWYHLKGSDPDTCRYLRVTVSNNQMFYQVYAHDKSTPVANGDYGTFFTCTFTTWGNNIYKYMITDLDSFKNAANANAAKAFVVQCDLGVWQWHTSGVVINGVQYYVSKQSNKTGLEALYYLMQTGYEPEPEPPEDDDPYAGDDSPYDPATPGGGDGDGEDPYDPGDPNPFPDDPPFSITDTGLMSVYTPDNTTLNLLAGYLWSSNFVTSLVKDLYADPMDVIISLGVLPFSITPAGTRSIKVGDRDSGISSPYPRDKYITVDCGSIALKSTIGAYIDFAPYTKGELYIPFVGFVPIDIDSFMGHDIGVKYKVEICTGSAVAFLMRDSDVWQTFACNLMTPIPLSSANYSQMWQTVVGATAALAGAGVAGAAGLGAAANAGEMAEGAQQIAEQSGNAAKASSGIMSAAATKPTIQKSNNISVLAGIMANRKPFITLERPNLMLPSGQNKYQGYPSYIESELSTLTGYSRVSSINLSVPSATATEIKMIDAILKSGFIVGSGTPLSGSGVILGKNNSPSHQIKKNVELVATLTGSFRGEIDIINPVVRVEYSDPITFNYVYISDFARYYFVEDVNIVRKGVLDIRLRVDVLDSFFNEILANKAILDKQEKLYNLYLNDDSLKMKQNPLISCKVFPYGLFESGLYTNVLCVAGN